MGMKEAHISQWLTDRFSPIWNPRKIVEQIEVIGDRPFNVVLETDHLIDLASFARAGMGVVLLPAFAVHEEVERGTLTALSIRHDLMQKVQAQLVNRRGRELPVGAVALQRLLISNMLASRA